jgi:heat shock protein HslJ
MMARRLITVAVAALMLALPASAPAASPLRGTSWKAKRIGGHVVPTGNRARLTFGSHHRFGGQDDCNSIGGQYEAKGSRLRFSKILSTLVGCEGTPGAALPSFIGALDRTRSYRMTSGRLLLLGARGRTLVRLARVH